MSLVSDVALIFLLRLSLSLSPLMQTNQLKPDLL